MNKRFVLAGLLYLNGFSITDQNQTPSPEAHKNFADNKKTASKEAFRAKHHDRTYSGERFIN